MQITGVRPANVTGPDKARGSMDHVLCVTQPARGQAVRFTFRDSMRLPIHVEDIAEIFVRVALAESTQHPVYNSGGEGIIPLREHDKSTHFKSTQRSQMNQQLRGRAASGN